MRVAETGGGVESNFGMNLMKWPVESDGFHLEYLKSLLFGDSKPFGSFPRKTPLSTFQSTVLESPWTMAREELSGS
jgi:hypothetical protein